jgi:hypothetical protein
MGIILEQGMFFLWLIVHKVNEKLSSKEIISKVMKYSNSKEYNLPKLVYDYKGIVFSKNSSQNNYFLSEPNLDNYNNQNIFPCNKLEENILLLLLLLLHAKSIPLLIAYMQIYLLEFAR